MAENDGKSPQYLAPPVLAAIRNEDVAARVRMERTASQEIREERADLKEAAEQSLNVIVDLGLDGIVRWVSPSWKDVIGTPVNTIAGKPIASILIDQADSDPFSVAMESMKKDDSKSHHIRFRVRLGPDSVLKPSKEELAIQKEDQGFRQDEPTEGDGEDIMSLEGQGIMVYERSSGGQSHTMWMIQPSTRPREITIDLPEVLVDNLGFGAEVLAAYLTELAEMGDSDPASHPPPMPILCRICECQVLPWWFEKHSELCLQEHTAEMDVQVAHEALTEHRNAIVKILDALEARSSRTDLSPTIPPAPEYKGLPIGSSNNASPSNSTAASARSSPGPPSEPAVRSREGSNMGLAHSRTKSFAARRPLSGKVELILDLCDTALDIKTPVISESHAEGGSGFRTQSPGSEMCVSRVLNWPSSSGGTLDNQQGLAKLTVDTETLATAKVEAVLRHRRIIEYSERIRIEFHVLVQECIEVAMKKAASIRDGQLSDSSTEGEEEEGDADTPAPQVTSFFSGQVSDGIAYPIPVDGMSAAAISEIANRRQSVAISTGSNSPMECPTPRSHSFASGILDRSHSMSKRGSIYADSEANDSDGSLASSVLLGRRTASPNQEQALARTHSSRERKRRSLKLPFAASPRRQQSPGRMNPPTSPLRLTKARIPSGTESIPSPITSPLLHSHDRHSPIDHRRHSSILTSVDYTKIPLSPRLSAINAVPPQQQRAVPQSIKDFEIIKPISKGAFGSVYLAKKKTTGDYFAIKVLKKSDMVAKNQVTNVKAERAIMMWQGESDFVAKLYWTFSSKEFLYLVMEYLNGGDCASLIKVLGGLPEDWAKKYLAEVVLGVEHLHSRGIVHRDLKPDNLLIDQKGHLKLTDFGLSRMGLIGRQKRLAKSPNDSIPDLLKQGPFARPPSMTSSRSASFDYQGLAGQSPAGTPLMTPSLAGEIGQPSYFSLGPHHSRRASGYRSDSGNSDTFNMTFRQISLGDDNSQRGPPIEEEVADGGDYSPDPYALQPTSSKDGSQGTPPQTSMLPPPMALFDPDDRNRRFVGTPDYLAPETIKGIGQDELSDWWSIGCILFEFLFGYPPFHADTPEKVFENILARKIDWPPEEAVLVSDEARNLMVRLMTLDPKDRLGANASEQYSSGGEEIRKHPWFDSINWDTLLEDEAQFVPAPDNPEDTEYFDTRGATLQSFAEEVEDQTSSSVPTPGADYPDRPHDALSRIRNQVNSYSLKRGPMPLHIPPHVRDARTRRLSEPVPTDDFGNFAYKNLPVLAGANKDVIQKLRAEALQGQPKVVQQLNSGNNSPAPSLEGSPLLQSPLKRTLSTNRNRPTSPSNLAQSNNASPSRPPQPTSPLLVQFSVGPNHERRKTSSTSSTLSHQSSVSLQPPGNFFDVPKLSTSLSMSSASISPVKASGRITGALQVLSPERGIVRPRVPSGQSATSGPVSRVRSHTLGSQEGEISPANPTAASLAAGIKPTSHHQKRRSQVFDASPSSSDNEDPRAKALLRVQRRRQSSRRMSQFSLADGPVFRPLYVLICEDHPVSRYVMESLLENLRCRTITCGNGPDAVRFATSEVQFDIIMMEVKLPQLNGNDVARMIRGTKNANQHTPIVAVTGYLKELPQTHHFDSLIEKPPTKAKLIETLCNHCQWKAPPADWHPEMHPQHTPSGLRQESHPSEDSPSSQSSGPFARGMGTSFRGSSRDDSIGSSSFFGDMDSVSQSSHDNGVIISQQGDDWQRHNGLGIMEDFGESKPFIHPGLPHLLHWNSAPPILDLTLPSPRKQRSNDAIRSKRETLEKQRHECADSGDDEDEELGDTLVQPKSPRSKARGSKLGTQMMRADSHGSVISGSEEVLRKEALLHHAHPDPLLPLMASLSIAKQSDVKTPVSAPVDPESISAHGGLTPPEVFSRDAAGDAVKDIDMDATPRPSVPSSEMGSGVTVNPDQASSPTPYREAPLMASEKSSPTAG